MSELAEPAIHLVPSLPAENLPVITLPGCHGTRIGVDLGGTQVRFVLIRNGKLAANVVRRHDDVGPSDLTAWGVTRSIAQGVKTLCVQNQLTIGRVDRIGVAVPGTIVDGLGNGAPNLVGWVDVPVSSLVSEQLGVDGHAVRAVNDADAAAWAEFKYGAAYERGLESAGYVTYSTGLGVGVVHSRNGESGLIEGTEVWQTVPEFGIRRAGSRPFVARCGGDVFEAWVGGASLEARFKDELQRDLDRPRPSAEGSIVRSWLGEEPSHVPMAIIYKAFRSGDPHARAFLEEAGAIVARGLTRLILQFDLQGLVLGGSIFEKCPEYRHLIIDACRALVGRSVDFVDARYGTLAGAIGAASL